MLIIIESRSILDDEETDLFMNFEDNMMMPLIISSDDTNNKFTIPEYHPPHRPKYPKHPKHPKHPKFPLPKRAFAYFPSPPDIAKGVMVFWETRDNNTLVYGQFSKGFVEGDEKKYSFKVYNRDQELIDLKPKNDSLDRIFKINANGSTELFLFVINDSLISNLMEGKC
ncbi:hypothetical protein GLOIN_2v1603781 [Rhizophagus clarus]|uniref:Uncharacterized protein n=1 Tax=Rhizophagus clarus TaxID=94130 RepID=A0A8H3LHN1_9GLOM|nr:hypothetical protein GLOIN_2v1603781 [Rhizophagus clarus]